MSTNLVTKVKCRFSQGQGQNIGSRKLLITFLSFTILSEFLGTVSTAPLINRSCRYGVLDVRFTREPDEHDFYCRDICTEDFKHYEKVCLNDLNVMKHCAAFVNCTITPATTPPPTPPPTPDSASLALKIVVPTAVIAGIILLAIIIAVIKKFHHRFLTNKVPNENQEEVGEQEDQALVDNPDDNKGTPCVQQAVDGNKSSLANVVASKLEKHVDS